MKDGVIKYNCTLINSEPISELVILELNEWRDKLHKHGLIGEDDEGIGFGNISSRVESNNEFIISGSQTGKIRSLKTKDYSHVINYNIDKNSLTCKGKINASSESLTHAIIYESLTEVKCVIHIHNKVMWEKLLFNEVTTSSESLYGSIELANEIKELIKDIDLDKNKIIVLAGHEDGIFFFGKSISEIGSVILEQIGFN